VKIYRIQKIDDIENPLEDEADWNYEILVYNGDEFVSQEDVAPSNNDDIIVDRNYQFDNIKTTYTTIYIHLWDTDLGDAVTEDADISSRAGYDYYKCAYDLELDNIDTSVSDTFVSDGGYYKTSGDYDGSTDTDENDANLWFQIWDNYTLVSEVPDPEIVSVTFDKTIIDYGDRVTITVKARNDGDKADEMYISVSLPDNPPIDNIQMVSHDLQDVYILSAGSEVWGDYGTTYPIVLEYPLVEGFKEYWETGETKTLEFRVKPQNPGTFRFFVKATTQLNGEWRYDPESGTRDQQNEYVDVYAVSVCELPVEPWYISQYADGFKIANFELVEDWVWRNSIPLLLLNSKSGWDLGGTIPLPAFDADTKLQEPPHRPRWYYRVVVDKTTKRFVVQLFGYWDYQYAGLEKCVPLPEHPYDYEPIFLYYTYEESDFFSSLKNGHWTYQYVFHTVWHGYTDHVLVGGAAGSDVDDGEKYKLCFWKDPQGKEHPVVAVGISIEVVNKAAHSVRDGHPGIVKAADGVSRTSICGHGYIHIRKEGVFPTIIEMGLSSREDEEGHLTGEDFIQRYSDFGYESFWPTDKDAGFNHPFKSNYLRRLEDDVVNEWKNRNENPFRMLPEHGSQDFVDPWNENYKGKWPSIGSAFEPNPLFPSSLLVSVESPIDLHLYDQIGRHTGINYQKESLDLEIPNAYFGRNFILLPNLAEKNYGIRLVGTSSGTYNLTIIGFNATIISLKETYVGDVLQDEIHYFAVTVSPIRELEVIPLDEGKGGLHLYVKDSDGNPISGATVTSTSQPTEEPSLTGTTDGNGCVAFNNIVEGSYTIQVSRSGYATVTKTETVTANQIIADTIVLTKEERLELWWILLVAIIIVTVVALSWLTVRGREKVQ